MNILTLLALVLATGMIVDDAIVVIENIQRQRRLGMKAYAASVLGTRQVFFAVIATTATLVSVFLPIAFLPSTAGKLFTEFGFVLAIAVAISSFVALSLCPMLASRLPEEHKNHLPTWPFGRPNWRRVSPSLGIYAKRPLARDRISNRRCVHRNRRLPEDRQGTPAARRPRRDYHNDARSRRRQPRLQADRQSAKAEGPSRAIARLRRSHEHSIDHRALGHQSQLHNRSTCPLVGSRSRSQLDIARELRGALKAIPGATARFRTPNSLNLRRAGGRVEFTLTGSDYRDIAAAADDFVGVMPAATHPDDDIEIEFQPDSTATFFDGGPATRRIWA